MRPAARCRSRTGCPLPHGGDRQPTRPNFLRFESGTVPSVPHRRFTLRQRASNGKEWIAEACVLRMNGWTLQSIANKFGVSRQYIHQFTPRLTKAQKRRVKKLRPKRLNRDRNKIVECFGCRAKLRRYFAYGHIGLRSKQKLYCRECKDAVVRPYQALQRRAHLEFTKARLERRIIPQPCERCGSPKVHGHHEDYSKPLEVMWLCTKHHGERHRELRRAA